MTDRSRATPYRHARWSRDEDERLRRIIDAHGPVNWNLVSSLIQSRTPKQCRQRYYNYLDPTLNHAPISDWEGRFIEDFHKKHGPRWAECARAMKTGRTDNAVKNYWNVNNNRRRREQLKIANCHCGHKETYHHGQQHHDPSSHSVKACRPKEEKSHYREPSLVYETNSAFSASFQSQRSSYSFPAQMFALPEKVDNEYRSRDEKSSISAASMSSAAASSNSSYALNRSSTGSDKLAVMTPPESSYASDAASVESAQGLSYGGLHGWNDRLPRLNTESYHASRHSNDSFRDAYTQPILRSQVHEIHPDSKGTYPGHLMLPHGTPMGTMQATVAPLPSPPVSTSPYDSQGQASPSKDDRMNINSLLLQ